MRDELRPKLTASTALNIPQTEHAFSMNRLYPPLPNKKPRARRGLVWYRDGMDWDSAWTVFAITFGHAIGGGIVGAFYSWKAKRAEIRMVRNWRGQYVDVAVVYERRAWIAWTIVVVGVLAGNAYMFLNMP